MASRCFRNAWQPGELFWVGEVPLEVAVGPDGQMRRCVCVWISGVQTNYALLASVPCEPWASVGPRPRMGTQDAVCPCQTMRFTTCLVTCPDGYLRPITLHLPRTAHDWSDCHGWRTAALAAAGAILGELWSSHRHPEPWEIWGVLVCKSKSHWPRRQTR